MLHRNISNLCEPHSFHAERSKLIRNDAAIGVGFAVEQQQDPQPTNCPLGRANPANARVSFRNDGYWSITSAA